MLNWTSASDDEEINSHGFYYHVVTVSAIDFNSHMSTRVEEGF